MAKTILLGFLLLLITACKQENDAAIENDSNYAISTENWPKKIGVSQRSSAILNSWAEFKAYDEAIDGLYTVENTEDLSLVIEDLIEKHKLVKEANYPTEFDKPQIKSRQKVVHTFVLKTKGNLEYRLDAEEPVIALLNAYNAMRNQFNVISGNTLDINTLLKKED